MVNADCGQVKIRREGWRVKWTRTPLIGTWVAVKQVFGKETTEFSTRKDIAR